MRDQIFTTPLDEPASFSFDEKVVACFPDMIRRSVPGYGQILAMISLLAEKQIQKTAVDKQALKTPSQAKKNQPIHIVDLGCSLGAVGLAIAGKLPANAFTMTAVDLSAPMVKKAKTTFKTEYPQHNIQVIQSDILDFDMPICDMVVLNFTLQFLPVAHRNTLINKIYDALLPQGVLLLSEKFIATTPIENEWLIAQHEAFKRANGYTELEVSQKRAALEDVLIRESLTTHHQRFSQAGFSHSHTWFQYLNFASMIAIK